MIVFESAKLQRTFRLCVIGCRFFDIWGQFVIFFSYLCAKM